MQIIRGVLLLLLLLAGCHAQDESADSAKDLSPPGDAAAPGAVADAGLDESAADYQRRTFDAAAEQRPEMAPEAVGAIASCVTCHGDRGEGNPTLGAPRIGGLAPWYLARQLKYFQSGVRGATDADPQGLEMRAMVLPLETTSLEDLANYVTTLTPPPAEPLTVGDAERGRSLYGVCAACHGPAAGGNADLNAPALAGQSGEYLVRQLEHYRTGLRGTNGKDEYGQQMLPIVKSSLTDHQAVLDVVTYIGTMAPSG